MTSLNERLAGATPLQLMKGQQIKGPQTGGGLIEGICSSIANVADMAVDAASPARQRTHDAGVGSLIHQGPSGIA